MYSLTTSICIFSNVKLECPKTLLVLGNISTLVLFGLVFKSQHLQYPSNEFRDSCKPSLESENKTKSSANIRKRRMELLTCIPLHLSSDIWDSRSAINRENNKGLSLHPCPSYSEIGRKYHRHF